MQHAPDLNQRIPLAPRDFHRIRTFVEQNLGIRLPESKQVMVESRLQKHLKKLALNDFSSYCDFLLESREGQAEIQFFTDLITTNKTDFFREPGHFDFLRRTLLPELEASGERTFRIWSAGCSSGEEPYTMVMVLEEYLRDGGRLGYEVHASDISEKVLTSARSAVYEADRIADLPLEMKKRYFLKSRDPAGQSVRVKPAYRGRVRFYRINFMSDQYAIGDRMHAIFFRNVMIYFEKPIQQKILSHLYRHLLPGGFLFLGHSESLTGIDVPLRNVSTTVYRKDS